MKILDRYVARQYLTNILSLYVILFAFVVTIIPNIIQTFVSQNFNFTLMSFGKFFLFFRVTISF